MAATFRLKSRDGSTREGLSAADLRALAKAGVIHPEDSIARSGTDEWTAAKKVRGLALGGPGMLPCKESPPDRAAASPSDGLKPGWRSVVQQGRHHVPLIESTAGQGSGVLVARNGLIVTNRHVVEGARVFMVTFYDGTKSKALVVHRHESLDLAVIRCAIHTSNYFDLMTGIATGFDAGDEVIAIGHPRGLTFTSTRGIISEPSRRLPDGEFVQTDVAINPGNSGGPLLDANGKLVGLNTQIQRDSQGLGFALPGPVVSQYCEQVETLVRLGELSLPTDEEIAALDDVMAPEAVLEAAIKSTDLKFQRPNTPDGSRGWTLFTPSGYRFSAFASETLFLLFAHVEQLSDFYRSDDTLLRQLLRWQDDMQSVHFTMDEEDNLGMKVSRSAEDLDISEARSALMEMTEAMDKMYQPIIDYLE